MSGETIVSRPTHFHLVPGASFSIAPKVLEAVLRPIIVSESRIGSDRNMASSRYTMMYAAPPLLPTIYGKRQMLPNPMADPAIARTAAVLLPKLSLPEAIS